MTASSGRATSTTKPTPNAAASTKAHAARRRLAEPQEQRRLAVGGIPGAVAKILERDTGDEQHVERADEEGIGGRERAPSGHEAKAVRDDDVREAEDEWSEVRPVREPERRQRVD